MTEEEKTDSGVDKSLVVMFLKMSPEERIAANDHAVRAILELRNAYLGAILEETLRQLNNRARHSFR